MRSLKRERERERKKNREKARSFMNENPRAFYKNPLREREKEKNYKILSFFRKREFEKKSQARTKVELFSESSIHNGIWFECLSRRCMWKGYNWSLSAA